METIDYICSTNRVERKPRFERIVKRTQKTPRKEIEKAKAIRAEWFNNKNK